MEVYPKGFAYPNNPVQLGGLIKNVLKLKELISERNESILKSIWNPVLAERSLLFLGHDNYLQQSQLTKIMFISIIGKKVGDTVEITINFRLVLPFTFELE